MTDALFLLPPVAQERKRALEAERQARVEELLMRRKEQEARIEQQRQEKEKAREDAARERARSVITTTTTDLKLSLLSCPVLLYQ